MCATQLTLQEQLKKSPMFNLSLSSKELFHSNMLAWIAEDADTEKLFVKILESFGVANNKATEIAVKIRKDEYMVLREYKNFDLCICKKVTASNTVKGYKEGQILLVLENKFKSIPYKAQLEKYQQKAYELNNSNAYPHFVLLSLTQNAYEFNFKQKTFSVNGRDWYYVSYKEYAELLLKNLPATDFKAQVIQDYANYIKEFSSYLNLNLPQLSQNLPQLSQNLPQPITDKEWTKTLATNDDLKPIRMDDIWQKLIANLILIELCEAGVKAQLVTSPGQYSVGTKTENFVKLQGKPVVHVGAGLSRASGLVEIKINIGDDCVFGVQIQGGLYKRLLETTKKRLPTNTSGQIAYYTPKLNVLSDMFRLNPNGVWKFTHNIFDNSQPLYPKLTNKKAGLQGFGGYDNTFIAQWKKISKDSTVRDVIAAMIKDCIEVRKLFP